MIKRILTIDDDELVLLSMEAFLINEGFQVMTINREELIHDTVAMFKPDLITLDIRLTHADGREICDKLKSGRTTSHIPVILLTALDYYEISRIECEADAIIGKPFETGSLRSTIRLLLDL